VVFLWGWFFDVDNGLLNGLLRAVGFQGLQWIQSPQQAMPYRVGSRVARASVYSQPRRP